MNFLRKIIYITLTLSLISCESRIDFENLEFLESNDIDDITDVEEPIEKLEYSFAVPDNFYGDSAQVFKFQLTKVESDRDLTKSDIKQVSTGNSKCDTIQLIDASEENPQIELTDCNGNGNLTLEISQARSLPVHIDNLADEQLSAPFDVVNTDDFIYVSDTGRDGIFSVNKSTGETLEISGPTRGTGESFSTPTGLVINKNETKFYALDNGKKAVIEIDIATGNRTVISSSNLAIGTGNNFSNPTRLILNNAEDKIYICSRGGSREIVEVDISTGNRKRISSNSFGNGDAINTPYGLAINSADTKLYFMGRNNRNLYEVDISNGDRTVISEGNNLSQGVKLSTPHGLILSDDETKFFINDLGIDAVVSIDKATGNRSVLSRNAEKGEGPLMVAPLGIAVNEDETKAYLNDSGSSIDGIIQVDLSTGDRSFLTKKH